MRNRESKEFLSKHIASDEVHSKKSDLTDTSRFISLILRHNPETIGITLDAHGWANVDELVAGIARTRKFDRNMLEEIVEMDNKD